MSLARCEYCGGIVDTDEDVECYYDEDGNDCPCTCSTCRDRDLIL